MGWVAGLLGYYLWYTTVIQTIAARELHSSFFVVECKKDKRHYYSGVESGVESGVV
jgi:hypothetical protein